MAGLGIPLGQAASNIATLYVTTVGTAAVQALAANPARVGALFYNSTAQTIYLQLGAVAGIYQVPVPGYTVWVLPYNYKGLIGAISGTAGQTLNATEFT